MTEPTPVPLYPSLALCEPLQEAENALLGDDLSIR